MDCMKTYEELNMILPFSGDISVQQQQREQFTVMNFMTGLPSEYEIAKSQILSITEITSMEEAFSSLY